ncbi:MAG: hypothetical protein QM762_05765 [Chryseolinea sp.]
MRTASRNWLVILFWVATGGAWAQDAKTIPDTITYTGTSKEIQRTPFERFWTKPRVVPKLGVGAMDRAFLELGVQLHSIYRHPLTLLSHGPYATVDVFLDDSNILLGPKLGYEMTAGLFGLAADATYFIDHNYDGEGGNRNSLMITPKAGISILGFANVFYGYAIPVTSDGGISSISRHRFSLVFNLNKDYFDLKDAPRRKSRSK